MAATGLDSSTASDAPSISLAVKLAFGAPGFGGAAMAIPIAVLMPQFYSDVVLAPLGMIALATAVARAFDALTDPVVGWLSDRTRTRWGRRKPWIAVGTPIAAVFFWLLFSPPAHLEPGAAVLWFGSMFLLFFLFQTIEGVPIAALGAELSSDYNERSSLFGIRTIFIAFGTMVAAILPVVLVGAFGPGREREIYSGMAAAFAAVWFLSMLLMLWVVPEHREYAERPSNPLVPGVRRALRNRPFSILLASSLIGAVPAAVPAILMPYFVTYVLQPDEPLAWVGRYLFLYLATGLLFVPLWLWAARRFGKLRAFISAAMVGVSSSLLYFFAGEGDLRFAGIVYFVSGTQSMAGNFLLPAMAADVIDYDELRTGLRREAQFTAFWAIIPKLVSIPGSSVPLAILAAVGYVPNVVQSAEVQLTIRFLYSLFPAAFFCTALFVISRYPISEAVHERIREGIAAHRRGEASVDPLTGEALPAHALRAEAAETSWFLDHFSPSELRAVIEEGPGALAGRVIRSAGACLLLGVVAAAMAAAGVESLSSEPNPFAVLGVVVAGLALTAFAFHALRIAAARQLAAAPPSPESIRDHLAQPH